MSPRRGFFFSVFIYDKQAAPSELNQAGKFLIIGLCAAPLSRACSSAASPDQTVPLPIFLNYADSF